MSGERGKPTSISVGSVEASPAANTPAAGPCGTAAHSVGSGRVTPMRDFECSDTVSTFGASRTNALAGVEA